MIITCPDCATCYQIKAESLGPKGRRVRCKSCEAVWFQVVQDAARPPGGGPDVSPAGFDVESEAARLMTAAQDANTNRQAQRRKTTDRARGWMVLAACLAAILAPAVYWRQSVVRTLPAAADLYALMQLPVNVRGLTFTNVKYQNRFENGVAVLTIKGEIENITDRPQPIPKVRFALQDATSQEIYNWTQTVSRKPLPPEGRLKFTTKLASPPPVAQHVQIRFVRGKPKVATAGK